MKRKFNHGHHLSLTLTDQYQRMYDAVSQASAKEKAAAPVGEDGPSFSLLRSGDRLRFHLKLLHRLAFLAVVPLAFEVVFVLSLVCLYNSAENEAAKISHSKAVIAEVDRLGRILYEVLTKRLLHNSQAADGDIASASAAQLDREVLALKILARDNKAEGESVERMSILSRRILGYFENNGASVSHLSAYFSLSNQAELIESARSLMAETNNIRDHEAAIQLNGPVTEARLRAMVHWTLIAGVVLSILITSGLVLVLYNQIVRRLNVIVDNTRRLAAKARLNPRLSGSDEIEQVDKVFHEMASSIEQTAQKEHRLQEMKQDFVEMVSHDLRTPLMSTAAFFELLGSGAFGQIPDLVIEKAKSAGEEMSRLAALTNNLLDVELLETGRVSLAKNTMRLSQLFERSIAAVSNTADKRQIKLISDEQTGAILYADEDRLVQVLVNLLSNAIKYSHQGDEVKLLASKDKEGDSITISVVDQGVGMDEELCRHVFDRYVRSPGQDAGNKGFGLGLAIAREIVQKHGGTIGVTSELGKGSVFWFKLMIDLED